MNQSRDTSSRRFASAIAAATMAFALARKISELAARPGCKKTVHVSGSLVDNVELSIGYHGGRTIRWALRRFGDKASMMITIGTIEEIHREQRGRCSIIFRMHSI